MLIKKPKHKDFEYIPRFYKPEEDREERLRKQLGFNRTRKFKKKGRSPLIWLVLLILVIYLYYRFSNL